MRAIWNVVVICGMVAGGVAGADEAKVCSLPEVVVAAPAGLEQAPVFVDTPAWCCLNGFDNGGCIEATVEACAAAGVQSYPFFHSCQRRTNACDPWSV